MILDCEQSLSFPSPREAKILERAIEKLVASSEPREARARRKRKNLFRASPHSLLVSFPKLHTINWAPCAVDFRNKNRLYVVYCNTWKRIYILDRCRGRNIIWELSSTLISSFSDWICGEFNFHQPEQSWSKMEITHEIPSRKNYHQVNIVPRALPYKKTGGGGGGLVGNFSTKTLFCGRGLKCFSPLRGTSSSDLIWSEAFNYSISEHKPLTSPSSLQSAVSLDRRSSCFRGRPLDWKVWPVSLLKLLYGLPLRLLPCGFQRRACRAMQ